MPKVSNVLIAIQARSTSKRFPKKVFEMIDGKPVLQHVIDACNRAAQYNNKYSYKNNINVSVAVLVPYGDLIIKQFSGKALIFEGPEDDVLMRYKIASDKMNSDYIVRITADCPLIPSHVITKHITTVVMNNHDYVSNVDEELRTAADGMDCEAFSKNLLDYVNLSAKEDRYREHVTLMMRENPPDWAKIGHIVGFLDMSSVKLSIDTPEDLERVRAEYKKIKQAIEKACEKSGEGSVYRFSS